jgi:hypothetical protein
MNRNIPADNPFAQKLIAQARAEGRIVAEGAPVSAKARAKRAKAVLVAESFRDPGTWTVAVATASETNERSKWSRNSRTIAARRAVSRLMGATLAKLAPFAEHYHRGGTLSVLLVRLGGHRLDRSNLPAALKAVEDAVALMLGADDGDPRWDADWQQEPGPGPVGVRVALSAAA